MVTLIQWGIGWHLSRGSFFFIPTFQYAWCAECDCGRMILRFVFGNLCIEIRRDTFEMSLEKREDNAD